MLKNERIFLTHSKILDLEIVRKSEHKFFFRTLLGAEAIKIAPTQNNNNDQANSYTIF